MSQILDVQGMRLVEEPENAPAGAVLECDLLVAGGGMGGCAAALAACRAGKRVVLTEETDWLGGQMTSQGVSALDEHRYIETFSGTRSYYELRGLIREYYRSHARLRPESRENPELNPGNGWVSQLCFEPRAAVWALEQLLEPHLAAGRLTVLLRYQAVRAEVEGDAVRSVTFRALDNADRVEVRAAWTLDATELGDLLPLAGVEYVSGAESAAETGEPHARPDAAAWCVQSFTYPFALERRPGERHALPEPEAYAANRERQPYTLRHLYHDRGWVTYRMFEQAEGTPGSFWEYRRLIDATLFGDARYPNDVAMINWPGNDYRFGSIIDVPAEEALAQLRRARDLALGFCRWLQTECPRDEGGAGYPELMLRAEVMGTADGFSKYPYIRESRRIRALRTLVETDIAAEHQTGVRACCFPDTVGVGFYAIDIHAAEGEAKTPPEQALPFQIPLSALVPVRARNLLPACKNIGTTHITNGAYRLHPIEWAIGEAVANVALVCGERGVSPQTLAQDEGAVRELQVRLVRSGVPLYWLVDVPIQHPAFAAVQLLAAWGVWPGAADRLHFGPEQPVTPADLELLRGAPEWTQGAVLPVLDRLLPQTSRADAARRLLDALTSG